MTFRINAKERKVYMGLRFGEHLAEKSENNLWLVCCVAGYKSKLRKHPKICVIVFQLFNTQMKSLIPSQKRNLLMAPANYWRYGKKSESLRKIRNQTSKDQKHNRRVSHGQ